MFFNPQSKAYAKAQGLPTTWSQEDQGYIARWYSYYHAESYETDGSRSNVLKVLATHHLYPTKPLYTLHFRNTWKEMVLILRECSTVSSKVYSAVEISMATFKFLYLTSIVLMDTVDSFDYIVTIMHFMLPDHHQTHRTH